MTNNLYETKNKIGENSKDPINKTIDKKFDNSLNFSSMPEINILDEINTNYLSDRIDGILDGIRDPRPEAHGVLFTIPMYRALFKESEGNYINLRIIFYLHHLTVRTFSNNSKSVIIKDALSFNNISKHLLNYLCGNDDEVVEELLSEHNRTHANSYMIKNYMYAPLEYKLFIGHIFEKNYTAIISQELTCDYFIHYSNNISPILIDGMKNSDCHDFVEEYMNDLINGSSKILSLGGMNFSMESLNYEEEYPSNIIEQFSRIVGDRKGREFVKKFLLNDDAIHYSMSFVWLVDYMAWWCLRKNISFIEFYHDVFNRIVKNEWTSSDWPFDTYDKIENYALIGNAIKDYDGILPLTWHIELNSMNRIDE